jgi:uncharacterized damage-inducible protein DinB
MKYLNWKEIIDQNSSLVQELFSKLSEDQLNLQPNANTWSIAQNLEHLIVINESYFPIIKELHAQSYRPSFHSKMSFLVNFFGKFVLNSVDPSRSKKMKTFPIWEPSKSNVDHGIIDRFLQHQEDLKRMIASTDSLISANVVIHSPASKIIVYKLATALDIIVTHETRHINQAKELL